jgi:transcriptional regulator with XRE-family HTH domain
MKPKTYIKNVRKKLGWGQEKLAQRLGTLRCNISNYETGRVMPPASIVLDLQDILQKEEKISSTGGTA